MMKFEFILIVFLTNILFYWLLLGGFMFTNGRIFIISIILSEITTLLVIILDLLKKIYKNMTTG